MKARGLEVEALRAAKRDQEAASRRWQLSKRRIRGRLGRWCSESPESS
jgi:hypothetical protein